MVMFFKPLEFSTCFSIIQHRTGVKNVPVAASSTPRGVQKQKQCNAVTCESLEVEFGLCQERKIEDQRRDKHNKLQCRD